MHEYDDTGWGGPKPAFTVQRVTGVAFQRGSAA